MPWPFFFESWYLISFSSNVIWNSNKANYEKCAKWNLAPQNLIKYKKGYSNNQIIFWGKIIYIFKSWLDTFAYNWKTGCLTDRLSVHLSLYLFAILYDYTTCFNWTSVCLYQNEMTELFFVPIYLPNYMFELLTVFSFFISVFLLVVHFLINWL